MSIDDLLRGLHGDRTRAIDDQLRAIETELAHRRLIGAEHTLRLLEEIADLDEQIANAQPRNSQEADFQQATRHRLEHERRMVHKELRDDHNKTADALHELRREHRELNRELLEECQRYERHTGTYDG